MTRDYVELQLIVNASLVDHITGVLSDLGAIAVSYQDAQNSPVLEPLPGEIRLWPKTIVIGLFNKDANITSIKKSLEITVGDLAPVSTNWVDDRDWVRTWMDRFKPMQFGRRLWIYPSWCKVGEHDPDTCVVVLDPGLAFGSGTHATTSLCLDCLEGMDLVGKTCVDYGCGSGILSVSALALGASHVYGTDIEEQALVASRENAMRNHVSQNLTLSHNVEDLVPSPVVFANIFLGPLISLEETLASLTLSGGTILLSGLLKGEEDELAAAYADDFTFNEVREREEWILVTATRN